MRQTGFPLVYVEIDAYKYIDRDDVNWFGCGGCRSAHCRRCVEGAVGALTLAVIKMKAPPYDGTGFLTELDLVHVYIHTK